MKRKLRLILFTAAIMILICVPAMAAEVIDTGNCGAEGEDGDNLTYTLTDDGVLTIQGKGKMAVYCFHDNDNITSVKIGTGVTSIGNDAFYGCSSLTSINIPNSVTSIGNDAFCYCNSLASINIPNSVTSIGNDAFKYCSSLTSIFIPESVTYLGSDFLEGCDNLSGITVSDKNNKYDSRNSCNAIIETTSNCLIKGCNNTVIPNNVTGIGNNAFIYCSSLTSINIPNSVTSIGEYAFHGCSSLTNINIPNSVTSFGDYGFGNCSSLTNINIPNSVTSIGECAFFGCSSLTTINIPNSVTSIEYGTFFYCFSLTTINIPNSVTRIGAYAFSDCNKLKDVYYSGTEEQWNAIIIESGNQYSTNATIHFSSEIESEYDSDNFIILNHKNNPIIALRSTSNGHYLTGDIGQGFWDAHIHDDATKIQAYEEFYLVRCSDKTFAIRSTQSHKFLARKTLKYTFCDSFVSDDSKLKIVAVDGDRNLFKIRFNRTGEYLYINNSNEVKLTTNVDEAEVFEFILRQTNDYTEEDISVLSSDEWFNYDNSGAGLYDVQKEIGQDDNCTYSLTQKLGYKLMYDGNKTSEDCITLDNAQLAVAYKENNGNYDVIIAIQGTMGNSGNEWGLFNTVGDVITNLNGVHAINNYLVQKRSYIDANFHAGYYCMAYNIVNHASDIKNKSGSLTLATLLKKIKNGSGHLTITGHSMGGAVAQIVAVILTSNNYDYQLDPNDITGRTFEPALALNNNFSGFDDWVNIVVSSDTVPYGDVTGSIMEKSGIHRLGKDVTIYDPAPDLNTSSFANIANAKHAMDKLVYQGLSNYKNASTYKTLFWPVETSANTVCMTAINDAESNNDMYADSGTAEHFDNKYTQLNIVGYSYNRYGNKWYKLSDGHWMYHKNVIVYKISDIPGSNEFYKSITKTSSPVRALFMPDSKVSKTLSKNTHVVVKRKVKNEANETMFEIYSEDGQNLLGWMNSKYLMSEKTHNTITENGYHLDDHLDEVWIKCPVDVTIYDSEGNAVADITNNEVTYSNAPSKVVPDVYEDEKVFYILDDDEYHFDIRSYNDGLMSIERYSLSETQSDVVLKQSYNDISLYEGMQLVLTSTDSEGSEDLSQAKPLELYEVIDGAKNTRYQENGSSDDSFISEVPDEPTEPDKHTHSFTNYIYNNDASYTADGTETALCDNGCGETDTRTAAGTKKILATAKFKSVTNTASGIKVTWYKVKDASGYYLYRKTGSGSYKKIKTLSSSASSYTDTAVKSKNGSQYTYKIKAYNGKVTGKYTTKTIYRLTGISLTSAKNVTSKAIALKWGKNTKASGYQIQYSTSKTFAKNNKSVTVNGYSKVSTTIKKLTKNKTYYVKVRAYKTKGTLKSYSAWSTAKAVKIRK